MQQRATFCGTHHPSASLRYHQNWTDALEPGVRGAALSSFLTWPSPVRLEDFTLHSVDRSSILFRPWQSPLGLLWRDCPSLSAGASPLGFSFYPSVPLFLTLAWGRHSISSEKPSSPVWTWDSSHLPQSHLLFCVWMELHEPWSSPNQSGPRTGDRWGRHKACQLSDPLPPPSLHFLSLAAHVCSGAA